MQYQQLQSFQKHLASASPDHLCRVYLVAVADDETRLSILQDILKERLPTKTSAQKFSAETDMKELLDALNSPSLFGDDPVVMCDGMEALKKEKLDVLQTFLSDHEPVGYLLLGMRKRSSLLKVVEKVGIVLDMTEEKPWDRDKRLQEMLLQIATKEGKRLSPNAIILLFERLGHDLSLLTQEVQKLCAFVGERPTIERTDIFRASPMTHSETLWKLAEELVWDRKAGIPSSQFYAMIHPLRAQLQLGYKILELQEQKVPVNQWNRFIPKVWPKTLEKRISQAIELGSRYFQEGLKHLYKVERMSRMGTHRPEVLFDLFQTLLRSHGKAR